MATRVLSNIVCSDVNEAYTLCISECGGVYSMGESKEGAHGHETKVVSPRLIESLKNIHSISCGNGHSVCLDVQGNVFTFGSNYYGQLGICKGRETVPLSHIPQKVNLPPIKQISSGCYFILCLSTTGFVYSFGKNDFGQLGTGKNTKYYNVPQKIKSLKNIDFIECGGFFSICKNDDGDIFCWGRNNNGELGLGSIIFSKKPIKCTSWPDDVVDIKCSNYHTLVLTSNQEVYTCGSNIFGLLGRQIEAKVCPNLKKLANLSNIVRIECGRCHSMCINVDGNVFVFGHNLYGQLGLGDTDRRGGPVTNPYLTNIIDISSKGDHVFVKTSMNEIFAFGSNKHSQLGIDTGKENQLTPIQLFRDNEDIWYSSIRKSRAKSARK